MGVRRHGFLHKLGLFIRQHLVYALVLSQKSRAGRVRNSLDGDGTLFVTVAFNEPRLVKLQLEALHKFVEDPFQVLIIDNSLNRQAAEEIRQQCDGSGAVYLPGPWNLFSLFQGSLSHSSTLDWAWKGLLKKLPAKTLVLLDHDIFPVSPIRSEDLLRGAIAAGREEKRAGMWYLWPGLLAVSMKDFASRKFTFMPYRELDSGGSLWLQFYSKMPQNSFTVYSRDVVEIMPGTRAEDSAVEVIDGRWVHLIDGSGWLDGTGKFERIFGTADHAGPADFDRVVSQLRELGVRLPA